MRTSRLVTALWAASGGLLVWVSNFPHLWFLAIIGMACLFHSLQSKYRVTTACSYAVSLFAPLVWWVHVLGLFAWVLLVSVCVVSMIFLAGIPTRRGVAGLFIFAAGYVVVEYLHTSVPWGGFPWGVVAFSQVDGPFAWLARFGGQYLVTGAVCFVGACLSRITVHPKMAMAGVLVFSVASARGATLEPQSTASLRVAAVQGGVPRPELPGIAQAERVLNNHIQQTMTLDFSKVDLIVWPESAAMIDPLHDLLTTTQIAALVATAGVPMVIGGVVSDSQTKGPANAALLWLPHQGVSARYDKRHLVPFGEYIPARNVLNRIVGGFTDVPYDYVAGSTSALFPVADQLLGPLICFEVGYDNLISESVRKGATGLLALSNNSTYLGTQQPEQQFAITRFRALEHARPVVVATTSGISGVINSHGQVVASVGEIGGATAVGDLDMRRDVMPTDRFGPWVLWLALGILAAHFLRQQGSRRKNTLLT